MRCFNSQDPPLELDACKTCGAVWFDPQEFGVLPEKATASPNEVRLRGAEIIARHRLEQLKQRGVTDSEPDEPWKTIPAFFGFPVEAETNPVARLPWVTWSLAVAILAVSVSAFFDLEKYVEKFGFIPAEAWRYGGLTSLTSFFLHGGILHLAGNLYFFLIFGDNVEDYLGRWRYGLLLLSATLLGDFTHWLAVPDSTVPCIGASGGISGVIVFYALEFPQARLGFLFSYYLYFRWIQIPAWGALVLWLLMQFVVAAMQLGGLSNVAATAHLGGAAAGVALWLWSRKIKLAPADSAVA